MTTTGTSTFNLDLVSIIEEAYERAGQEVRTGWEVKTARRSLNLLMLDWSNRGYNMWLVDTGTIPMIQGQIEYDLPVDTIDLVDQVIRTQSGINQTDINITRISLDTYSTIPNKNAQGRPIQVWINRQSGAVEPVTGINYPTINVWPCPDQNNFYTFVYWRLRRVQDAGSGVETQDIPFRFLPAMVAGLAYYLAMKTPEGLQRLDTLKMQYDEAWGLAADEDREKAPLRLAPRQMYW